MNEQNASNPEQSVERLLRDGCIAADLAGTIKYFLDERDFQIQLIRSPGGNAFLLMLSATIEMAIMHVARTIENSGSLTSASEKDECLANKIAQFQLSRVAQAIRVMRSESISHDFRHILKSRDREKYAEHHCDYNPTITGSELVEALSTLANLCKESLSKFDCQNSQISIRQKEAGKNAASFFWVHKNPTQVKVIE
jgi:hypothetical protein